MKKKKEKHQSAADVFTELSRFSIRGANTLNSFHILHRKHNWKLKIYCKLVCQKFIFVFSCPV